MHKGVKQLTNPNNKSTLCSEREVSMGPKKHQNSENNGKVKNFEMVSDSKVTVTWNKWRITAAILVATQVAGQL
jgi:hypothetical protein